MGPAEHLALAVVVAGAFYLAAGAALDLVRFATRLRLSWLPSLQRTLVAAGLVVAVARSTPAGAALPPPALRLEPARVETAVVAVHQPAPALPPAPAAATYLVQPGDSLWAIAARALGAPGTAVPSDDVDRYWRAIYDANRELVGADPDLIFPGQTLVIPAPG